MKGIHTPGQAQESGGFASFSAPRGEVWILTLPALAREREHCMVPFLSLRLAIMEKPLLLGRLYLCSSAGSSNFQWDK